MHKFIFHETASTIPTHEVGCLPEMEYSSPGLVLESELEYGSSVLESVLEYRRAILGLDLRLPVLGLDSYSATAILVNY